MMRNCNRSRDPGPSGRRKIQEAVSAAKRLRESLFGPFGREEETSAYRFAHAAGDGLDGFFVDAYGGFLVVNVLREEALSRAGTLEATLAEVPCYA